MRRLFYASGSFLIGDVMCKAVIRYARALAETGDAAIIAIPVLTDEGLTGNAHLLIGPSSQIFSMPAESNGEDPFDEDIANELAKKTRALQPSRPTAPESMTDILDLGDFDNV